jgi:hypothetical protein
MWKRFYEAVYEIESFGALPDNAETLPFAQSPGGQVVAALTTDPDGACARIDRARAVAGEAARCMMTAATGADMESRVAQGIAQQRAARRRSGAGRRTHLWIRAEVPADPPLDKLTHLRGDVSWHLEGNTAFEMPQEARGLTDAALAALRLVSPGQTDAQVREAGRATYLLDDAHPDRPVHTVSVNAGPVQMYTVHPMSGEALEAARRATGYMRDDPKLTRVARLLGVAQKADTDELTAFITAWTALEMFVNITFSSCYHAWWQAREAAANGTSLVAEARPVGKFPLSEKFAVLAEALHSAGQDEDLGQFRALKDQRDALVHRFEGAEGPFPTAIVIGLLAEYLRRHLDERFAVGLPPGPADADPPR